MSRRVIVLLAGIAIAVSTLAATTMAWAQEAVEPTTDPSVDDTHLFSDSWNNIDGAAWDGSRWNADGGSSATLDVQSEQGRMRFENVSNARARAIALIPKAANTEVLMSFRFPSTSAKGYLQIFSRASGDWPGSYPNSAYYVEIANDSSNVGLTKVLGATRTALSSGRGVGQVTTQKQWLRLRVEGPELKVKVWTDGTTEPSNWEIEATDTSVSGAGVLQLKWARASMATDAREVHLDDLTVSDLGEYSPLPLDPSGLTATAASTSQIDLNWTDNATNETAYVVERSLDGSTGWEELTATLPAGTTSYYDTGLSADTSYHYRVKATNASGSSGYSQTASTATHQPVPPTPTPNLTPDDTWMTDGIVYSVVRYGDYIYVGGQFTKVRRSPTGQSFLATNFARFDADTGVADPTWTPDVTGADMSKTRVKTLAAAGGKIWVGGKFDAVDGVARQNLAAVSPNTGVVDPTIDPPVNAAVEEILPSSTKVYVGGDFSSIDGKGRRRLGTLDFFGNVDPTWKPKADGQVRSLAFACDGATVFASGNFRNAAGPDGIYSPRETVARFDATSGSLHPWAIPAGIIGNDENGADLAVTCERITVPYLGPNKLRSFRLDEGNTGTLAWEDKCGGDPQTVAMLGSDKLVVGGHFSQVAGEKRTRIALINLSDGSPDPSWKPAVDGDFYGPWDLLVDENHLYVGGKFKTVAGLERHNFARFTLF